MKKIKLWIFAIIAIQICLIISVLEKRSIRESEERYKDVYIYSDTLKKKYSLKDLAYDKIELKEEKEDIVLYYSDLLNIYDDACIKSLILKKENKTNYYYSDILFQKSICYYDALINQLEKSEMIYAAQSIRKNKKAFIEEYKYLNKNL